MVLLDHKVVLTRAKICHNGSMTLLKLGIFIAIEDHDTVSKITVSSLIFFQMCY